MVQERKSGDLHRLFSTSPVIVTLVTNHWDVGVHRWNLFIRTTFAYPMPWISSKEKQGVLTAQKADRLKCAARERKRMRRETLTEVIQFERKENWSEKHSDAERWADTSDHIFVFVFVFVTEKRKNAFCSRCCCYSFSYRLTWFDHLVVLLRTQLTNERRIGKGQLWFIE